MKFWVVKFMYPCIFLYIYYPEFHIKIESNNIYIYLQYKDNIRDKTYGIATVGYQKNNCKYITNAR